MRFWDIWICLAVMVTVTSNPAVASESINAAGQGPVLTIRQIDAQTSDTGEKSDVLYAFTMPMMHALPQTTYTTSTIWTDGVVEFTGVLLTDMLDTIAVSPNLVTAWAINDYMAEFSPDDVGWGVALIAHSMNGQPMPVREKGPLWIVFPYDASVEYRSDYVFSQSIWQLNRLNVE